MAPMIAQTLNVIQKSQDWEGLNTAAILSWVLEAYHPRIALACSFQAEESVLIDLMHRVRGADFRLFILDTGRSIGAAPCTRAVKPGEDLRAGRWWWENLNNKECGLHVGREA